jgi:hypothetical protein
MTRLRSKQGESDENLETLPVRRAGSDNDKVHDDGILIFFALGERIDAEILVDCVNRYVDSKASINAARHPTVRYTSFSSSDHILIP